MRKFFILLTAIAIVTSSFASSGFLNSSPRKTTEIYLPINKTMQISLKDLSEIKIKDYEKISGKHLNLFEKITFEIGQKKLRNSIASDGTINNRKLSKVMSADDHSVGFHIGGFALGFFLGLIGVLIAYIIKGDEAVDKNRRKWAWIGFGVYVVLILAIVLTAAPTMYY